MYALNLEKAVHVGHMAKKIQTLDAELMEKGGRDTSYFAEFNTGIVKTFSRDEHDQDVHYNAIFACGTRTGGKKMAVQPGVKVWCPSSAGYIDGAKYDAEAAGESGQARSGVSKRTGVKSAADGSAKKKGKR